MTYIALLTSVVKIDEAVREKLCTEVIHFRIQKIEPCAIHFRGLPTRIVFLVAQRYVKHERKTV